MKTIKIILALFVASLTLQTNAQTADEIIETYYENTGGKDNWAKVTGMTMNAKVNQGGMEIPIEITQMKDGKQMTVVNFQGKEIKQGVFDGEVLWSINFLTQKAEKSDKEATDNFKIQSTDFPGPLFNYKEKGYKVELIGKEEFSGTECFKIKLTQKPIVVDGKEEENTSFYYFDTENFVPIAVQTEIKSGPGKGMVSEVTMSDYQEVEGLYFPFSMTQGVKGQPGSPISIDKIALNPKIDASEFKFPEESESGTDKN
ncbi:MAG: outer membrane lipoprotein-sorting protein [Flavobacteriaceae bacterium]|nr:outer membrane lipoprotein-sorting protein [Flavobacteriaceae bacterium]